jgi:hypothetical protein
VGPLTAGFQGEVNSIAETKNYIGEGCGARGLISDTTQI